MDGRILQDGDRHTEGVGKSSGLVDGTPRI